MRRTAKYIMLLCALTLSCICSSSTGEIQMEDVFLMQENIGRQRSISVPPPAGSEEDDPDEPTASGLNDILEFTNKDKIHGELVSATDSEFGLKWKHVDVKNVIDFSATGISRISLKKRGKIPGRGHKASVTLTNDDKFRGDIVSLDGENLIMETWYGGRVTIKRSMLKLLNPSASATSLVYEGPTGLSGWTMSNNGGIKSWTFKDNAFFAQQSYSIGKTIPELPDSVNISFKAAWRGYPQFYFAFYTDNIQQYYGNCYMMQVGSSSVYLQSYARNGGQKSLGTVHVPDFGSGQSTHATFNLLVDKKKKKIVLMINGKLIQQWQDSGSFAGKGQGILFQPQSQANLKISNIRIMEWDGTIPQPAETGTKTEEDMIRLANGDKVSGSLEAISDDMVSFKTSYTTLNIPLDRILEVSFSGAKAERARRNNNDLRAHFESNGAITIQLSRIENGKISGRSENFGEITMPLAAFRLLEFNIYTEEKENDDNAF